MPSVCHVHAVCVVCMPFVSCMSPLCVCMRACVLCVIKKVYCDHFTSIAAHPAFRKTKCFVLCFTFLFPFFIILVI